MEKNELRQILARRLRYAMETNPNLDTQQKLAARSGISQQHIGRLLKCDGAATLDALVGLAKALKCEPWELLADTQSTREAALRRMLVGEAISDELAAKHLPPPPKVKSRKARAK